MSRLNESPVEALEAELMIIDRESDWESVLKSASKAYQYVLSEYQMMAAAFCQVWLGVQYHAQWLEMPKRMVTRFSLTVILL